MESEADAKKEKWVEIVELARRGEFATLAEYYPEESVLHFANLCAMHRTIPLAQKKPALKRSVTEQFFEEEPLTQQKKAKRSDPAVPGMGPVLEWFATSPSFCELCHAECEKNYEFAYTNHRGKHMHIDRACHQCKEEIRETLSIACD